MLQFDWPISPGEGFKKIQTGEVWRKTDIGGFTRTNRRIGASGLAILGTFGEFRLFWDPSH